MKDEAPSKAEGVEMWMRVGSVVDVVDGMDSGRVCGVFGFSKRKRFKASSMPVRRSLICSICFSLKKRDQLVTTTTGRVQDESILIC